MYRNFLYLPLLLMLLSGCVSKSAVRIMPLAALSMSDKYYVSENNEDENNAIHDKIVVKMKNMGFQMSPNIDCHGDNSDTRKILVNYTFKKTLTGGLLELEISFREVAFNFPVAQGRVIDSQVHGKSVGEMIDDILTKIVYGARSE